MSTKLSFHWWMVSSMALILLGVAGIGSSVRAASPGDLIMCDYSKTVYYIGEDNKRYTFPNDKIFFTWYPDFDAIEHVTCDELQTHTLGGVVKYRPGMRLVKMPSVPVVYAVSPNGVLRPIKDEDQAKKLYGNAWTNQVDDLSEAFFPQYSVTTELNEEELPEGMLIESETGSILQVDEDGEVVDVDDVLDRNQKALLRRSTVKQENLEARLGQAIARISELESEIERLERALERLKAVKTRQSTTSTDTSSSRTRTQDTTRTRDDSKKLPDLTVSSISLSGSAIQATVKNIGLANAGSTQIYFWLDGVLEWTYSSTTLADQSFLLSGGSSFITPQQIVGERTIKVCIDPLNSVTESSESNNCLTQTLNTGEEGDFTILNVATYMLDALGNPDPVQRTFGFEVSAPMDHFVITVYNPNGSIHDQLTQQLNNDTVLSWYVSPSWLTPLQYSTTYTYTIHAEEYGTGDADTVNGTFVTGAAPTPLSLTVTYYDTNPHASATASPGDDVTLAIYEFDAPNGDVWVDQIWLTALVEDNVTSPLGAFSVGTDGPVVAQDHLTNCRLINTADQSVLAGPVGMYGPYPDQIYFYDTFLVSQGSTLSTNVRCTFSSLAPSTSNVDKGDGFAVDIPLASDVIANENSLGTGASVTTNLPVSNGNPPNFHILLQ